MKPGTQIAYIPNHVAPLWNGAANLDHPDVQFGFVTNGGGPAYHCRFWHRGKLELRTTANSEMCMTVNLVEHISIDQWYVDRLMKELGYGLGEAAK